MEKRENNGKKKSNEFWTMFSIGAKGAASFYRARIIIAGNDIIITSVPLSFWIPW